MPTIFSSSSHNAYYVLQRAFIYCSISVINGHFMKDLEGRGANQKGHIIMSYCRDLLLWGQLREDHLDFYKAASDKVVVLVSMSYDMYYKQKSGDEFFV